MVQVRRLVIPGRGGNVTAYEVSILERLQYMRRMVVDRRNSQEYRLLASRIIHAGLAGIGGDEKHTYYKELGAIFDWVRNNIRYTADPSGLDVYYPPEYALKARTGDCDEMAVLIAILAESVGYPAKFRSVAKKGDNFCHVYAMVDADKGARSPGRWIAMDTVYATAIGAEPPYTRSMDLHV